MPTKRISKPTSAQCVITAPNNVPDNRKTILASFLAAASVDRTCITGAVRGGKQITFTFEPLVTPITVLPFGVLSHPITSKSSKANFVWSENIVAVPDGHVELASAGMPGSKRYAERAQSTDFYWQNISFGRGVYGIRYASEGNKQVIDFMSTVGAQKFLDSFIFARAIQEIQTVKYGTNLREAGGDFSIPVAKRRRERAISTLLRAEINLVAARSTASTTAESREEFVEFLTRCELISRFIYADNNLVIETVPLTNRDVNIGRLLIRVRLSSTRFWFAVSNLDYSHLVYDWAAPHSPSDEMPCFGTAWDLLSTSLVSGKYSEFVSVVLSFFQTCNRDDYWGGPVLSRFRRANEELAEKAKEKELSAKAPTQQVSTGEPSTTKRVAGRRSLKAA